MVVGRDVFEMCYCVCLFAAVDLSRSVYSHSATMAPPMCPVCKDVLGDGSEDSL